MKLKLVNKKEETPGVISFYFASEIPINWTAGQFLYYEISDPKPDDRLTRRYFSISSAPFEKLIRLTTKFVPGDGSTFKKDLLNLKIGDLVEARGPSGDFILEDTNEQSSPTDKDYVFIAGGIGITPFHSIILDLNYKNLPINITLLYANRDQNILFKNDLEGIAKSHPEFKIYYVLDPQRIDANIIKQYIPDILKPIYYVSGPEPMVEAMEKIVYEMGVPKEQVKRDYFPGYTWP
ncbi:FAD-dependent oxidoreductase [Candidatus Daviesbacteria bacterium]|nr:FAD-dependent oxidoreductase [Candidatus Daviesbacteria bacterium]